MPANKSLRLATRCFSILLSAKLYLGLLMSITSTPRHIAIIMDGNGRWAKKRLLPRAEGHRRGVKALEKIVHRAGELGVEALTVFAFSSENWRRPKAEVDMLMKLFAKGLVEWAESLKEKGVRLQVIGERSAFPEDVRRSIDYCEAKTAEGERMVLSIAANYGGRWDLVQAAQRAAEAGDLSYTGIERFLTLSTLPELDLLIRTGGEQRISNFLLWQAAYAELYFDDTLWPDFDEASLDAAIEWFHGRERRFGMTSEQIREGVTGL